MKKHEDYVTHIKNTEDEVYLRNVHFPVNMRLFTTSPEYKNIIIQQCNYIRERCLSTIEGYKKPHGMSSANLGLAHNIIGTTINRNRSNEYCKIMINPKIHKYLGEVVETNSNCGSITLDTPLKLKRYEKIDVSYYDEQGNLQREVLNRSTGSFTVQHEVDHNNGILITDRLLEG